MPTKSQKVLGSYPWQQVLLSLSVVSRGILLFRLTVMLYSQPPLSAIEDNGLFVGVILVFFNIISTVPSINDP